MAESTQPRYLTASQAAIVKAKIAEAVRVIERALIADGADPKCFDHEIGIALARAACRLDLDLLAGASSTIERLEAVVAELGGKLEQAKIATGHVETLRKYPIEIEIDTADRLALHRALVEREASASAELAGAEAGEVPHPIGCRCLSCRA